MGDKCVEFAVRVRRLTANEIKLNFDRSITTNNRTIRIQKDTQRNCEYKEFNFDYVFDEDIGQEQLYNTAVKGMIDCIFEGRTSTIFVYGADGTGKSYSLGTKYTDDNATPSGIIPRVIQDLFNRIDANAREGQKFIITMSFMKLYNTKLYDLLKDATSKIEIREDERRIKLIGLTEQSVNSLDEFLDCLRTGLKRDTSTNGTHNRSHEILTIIMSQRNESEIVKVGKFNFVDLASSQSRRNVEEIWETNIINQELLALSKVLTALSKNSTFIGHRDQKLTRILQDSLTVDSKTLIIACVSPAFQKIQESYLTLKYANHPKKNQRIIPQIPKILRDNISEMNHLIAYNEETMKCTVMPIIKKRLKDFEEKMKIFRDNQMCRSIGNSKECDAVKETALEEQLDTIQNPERAVVPSSTDERIPELIENPAEPEEIKKTTVSIDEYYRVKEELEKYKNLYAVLLKDKKEITLKNSRPRSPAGTLAIELEADFSYSSDESTESEDPDWIDSLSPKTLEVVNFLTVPQESGRRTRSRSS